MKKNILYIILLAVIIINTLSCKKFVTIDLPRNQIPSVLVFEDSAGANAALAGIYINIMQSSAFNLCNGGLTAYSGLSSDELSQTSTNTNLEFYSNNISARNSTNRLLWSTAYKYIYQSNACIEGVEKSKTITATQKKALIGEAKYLRGFFYFNLVNLYGGVPLVLTTDYEKNRLLVRATESDVYLQIIDDLLEAQSLLSGLPLNKTRAGYFAATALLAKAYLYVKKYEDAKAEASKIINSNYFELEGDLNNVFSLDSKETIFALLSVSPERETTEGFYFVPSAATAIPKYIVSPSLINSLEPGDKRKEKWIKSNYVKQQEYPFPNKYKKYMTSGPSTERYTVLRLGEQYLIRAEAFANMGNVSDAVKDLNAIRERSGLSDLDPAMNVAQLQKSIEEERRAELMFEWGNRWFDLKRTDRINDVLTGIKPNWKATASLYPIPENEIEANPLLKQNVGY